MSKSDIAPDTSNISTEAPQSAKASQLIPLPQAPVRPRTWWLMIVAQMEQTVINVLTLAVGALVPMMNLYYLSTTGTEPDALMQGCVAAAGLFGITIGAPLFGYFGDKYGYLWLFRLCAFLIFAGGMGGWLLTGSLWLTVASLFTVGLGIGGGYSLDDVYLSELMPKKQRTRLIGIAKTIAAFGAFWGGLATLGMLHLFPHPVMWRWVMITVAALGLISILMRIRWWESPRWLVMHGKIAEAQKAINGFLGPGYEPSPIAEKKTEVPKVTIGQLFHGKSIWKVIATSIPWAMEGVGAFGMGTFMPIILMSLGLHMGGADITGVPRIEDSVLLSSIINFFLTVGFMIGLWLINRYYHIDIMKTGFFACAMCIVLVVLVHRFHWSLWTGVLGFILFETSMCAGPGIITFILPAEVFTIAERGAGAGIAASIGKLGGVIGVFVMPWLMGRCGIDGTLLICAAIMLIGGIVTAIAGPRALHRNPQQ